MTIKTVFYLDGGAGRVLAAIPAFLKYAKAHPEPNWAILVVGADALFWGMPELQDRVFNTDAKGVFDLIVKNADRVITPEPYRLPAYFNQRVSLAEAFDVEINGSTDFSDLGVPKMVFNMQEQNVAKATIAQLKQIQKKAKTVVIQPFGRGAQLDNTNIFDPEARSLAPKDYLYLVKKLSQKYNTIFFGEPQFKLQEDPAANYTCDLRQWGALIAEADYFIGVDSVGQHIARAVGVPGTVIFGSTYPINTSYPGYFQIIENKNSRKYAPIRIAGLDVMLANRVNEPTMKFSEKELNDIFSQIVSHLEKTVR